MSLNKTYDQPIDDALYMIDNQVGMENYKYIYFIFDKRKFSKAFLEEFKNLDFSIYNFTIPYNNKFMPSNFQMVKKEDESVLRIKKIRKNNVYLIEEIETDNPLQYPLLVEKKKNYKVYFL